MSRCTSLASSGNQPNCATELTTLGTICSGSGSDAGSGTGTGTGSTGTGTGLGTGTGTGTGTGSGAIIDSGSDSPADTGTDAGSDAGSGTGTGTGTGTGRGGSVPTTCAEANNAIGCCGPDGKAYYCTGSGTGGMTVKAKTCTTGTVCGWDTAKHYYYCVASPGTAPAGDPMTCQ